jgi:hypothetical protein
MNIKEKKIRKNINILQYLKKLFTKWIFYLGIILLAYDLINVYFPEPLKSFRLPSLVNYILAAIFFIIASYGVWLEEKRKVDELTKNTTEFFIETIVYKLTAKKHLIEIENEIEEIDRKILIIEGKNNNNGQNNMFQIFSNVLSQLRPLFPEQDLDYYKKYKEKLVRYKKDILQLIDKNIIHFNLLIEADRYDENIDIKVSLVGGSEFIETDKINFPENPLANKTSQEFPYNLNFKAPNLVGIDPFRRDITIDKQFAGCNLKSLKKDEECNFLYDGVLLLAQGNEIKLEITVNSKYSNGEKKYNKNIILSEIKEELDIKEIENLID